MTRRLSLLIVLIVVTAAGWWLWQRRGTTPTPSSTAKATGAPAPMLGMRLEVHWTGAGDDAVAVIRVGDAGAARRQAIEAAEAANGQQYRGAARARALATPPATPPENWASLVQLTSTTGGAAATVAMTPAETTEPGAAMFVFRAAAGATLRASLPFNGATVTSNVVTLKALADGPARLIAQGRVAEILKRGDAMATASKTLLASDARSAWGHYFTGAALELGGDKAGALAAYRRALEFSPRSYEPPLALLDRIARLTAK